MQLATVEEVLFKGKDLTVDADTLKKVDECYRFLERFSAEGDLRHKYRVWTDGTVAR